MLNKKSKIFVTGHKGMVGSAILRLFIKNGFTNLIFKSKNELDLRDLISVKNFFELEKPEIVILSAARVGGIQSNIDHPAEFLYENLLIQNNVIHLSYLNNVKLFCFLGSSCIYPRDCRQPMKEEDLFGGYLEPTNEGYAIAKIAGIKMIEYYNKQYGFNGISLIPCNLYGTNDHFELNKAHVLSSLVKRFVDAVDTKSEAVTLWGTGIARREFMHVDDAAEAIFFMLTNYKDNKFINIGTGEDIAIKELANLIAEEAGYKGNILWDTEKPDGMLRKCLDITKMKKLGFSPKISLKEGIHRIVNEYKIIKNSTKNIS